MTMTAYEQRQQTEADAQLEAAKAEYAAAQAAQATAQLELERFRLAHPAAPLPTPVKTQAEAQFEHDLALRACDTQLARIANAPVWVSALLIFASYISTMCALVWGLVSGDVDRVGVISGLCLLFAITLCIGHYHTAKK